MMQPHEDVTGTDRSASDLLSLDDRALEHRDALIAMAYVLSQVTVVGNPAPIVQRIRARMVTPAVGDLVVETTRAMGARDKLRVRGFGVLLADRIEWAETDAEWAAACDGDPSLLDTDRTTERVYYIQYGPTPNDVCRWVDCEFLALPTLLEHSRAELRRLE
jgi:hypothetical protein